MLETPAVRHAGLLARLLLIPLVFLGEYAYSREPQPPPGAQTFEVGFPPPGSSWIETVTLQKGATFMQRFTVLENGLYGGKSVYRVEAGSVAVVYDGKSVRLVALDGEISLYDAANRCQLATLRNGKEVVRYSPHNGMFSSPLWVGKKWIHLFRTIDQAGKTSETIRMPHQVQAYEDVTVPTGTFKALKIHTTGDSESTRRPGIVILWGTDLDDETVWYAPELKLVVKSVSEMNADADGGPGKITRELGVKLDDPEAWVAIGLKFSQASIHDEALQWYRMAAARGNARALNKLGVAYYSGLGVPQDYAEAFKWYQEAALKGSVNAQYNVGLMYGQGLGVEESGAEAMKWYRKAAEQGHEMAKKRLESKD